MADGYVPLEIIDVISFRCEWFKVAEIRFIGNFLQQEIGIYTQTQIGSMLPFFQPSGTIRQVIVQVRQIYLTLVVAQKIAIFTIPLQPSFAIPGGRNRGIGIWRDIPVYWYGQAAAARIRIADQWGKHTRHSAIIDRKHDVG